MCHIRNLHSKQKFFYVKQILSWVICSSQFHFNCVGSDVEYLLKDDDFLHLKCSNYSIGSSGGYSNLIMVLNYVRSKFYELSLLVTINVIESGFYFHKTFSNVADDACKILEMILSNKREIIVLLIRFMTPPMTLLTHIACVRDTLEILCCFTIKPLLSCHWPYI